MNIIANKPHCQFTRMSGFAQSLISVLCVYTVYSHHCNAIAHYLHYSIILYSCIGV